MDPARTETIQIQTYPTITLTLKPDSIVNRLTEIMQKVGAPFYSLWKDPLSLELMDWGCEIISIDMIEAIANEAEFIQATKKELILLINKVMVDKLIKTPLEDPVLVVETRWTCEKMFLEGCNHGKELTLVPHTFAKDIFNWAFSLISKQDPGALTETGESFVPGEDAYRFYRLIFLQAFAAHQLNSFIQETKENSELMKLFMEMIANRSKELLDEAKEESEKALAEVEKRITEIELTSAQKTNAQKEIASDLSQQVKKGENAVAVLREQVSRQMDEIAALRFAYHQRCQEVQALQAQAGRKKRPWWKIF